MIGALRKFTTRVEKDNPAAKYIVGTIFAAFLAIDGYYLYQKSLKLDHLTMDFHELPIESILDINHDTKLYRIKAKSQEMPICSHIVVKDDTCQIARPYTPIRSTPTFFEILVKRYPNGRISNLIHNSKVGDTLTVCGPVDTMIYHPNVVEDLGLICGGTGIAPMYQILKKVLPDPNDSTKITMIYANKTMNDILLKRELDILAERYPDKFKIIYTLEKPERGWKGNVGRITRQILDKLPTGKNVGILVCGPDGLVNSVAGPKLSETDQGPLGGHLATRYEQHQVFKF